MDTESGRRPMEAAQETAERAGEYAQARVTRLSERAKDAARGAGDQVERLTGRSMESWTATVREFVRDHPLQAIAVTVGVGYVLGKMMRRG
jgi:ElaB/YqjD/DUF883 family membrane-anchored ribosome-binding protein